MRNKLKQLWPDPVWSKVIAFIFISALTYIVTVFYKLIIGLWNDLPIYLILDNIISLLSLSVTIPVSIILFLVAVCLTMAYNIGRELVIKKTSITTENSEPESKGLPFFHYSNDLNFFSTRIGHTIPGVRNELKWFSNEEAVKRLLILLKEPLTFRYKDESSWIQPLWWLRAGSSMYIEKFQRLSKNKCLMNIEELIIDKIAVYKHPSDYKNFVYVECNADSQSGAYNFSKELIEEYRKENGYFWEEFGQINGKFIKREEYDDGAAEVKGEIIDAHDAELRVRYLTKYNFIIVPNASLYNSNRFDAGSNDLLNGLLSGEKRFGELFNFLMTFNRYEE